jgi:hypothetical protein
MGVILESYDGIADPKSVNLDRIHVWVQICGVHPLFHKEEMVQDMVVIIGDVLGVDMYGLGVGGASFMRVTIKLDVNKLSIKFVDLHPDGQERMHF